MYVYHFYATKTLFGGRIAHMDGIVRAQSPVLDTVDYARIKKVIAEIDDGNDIGGPDGMTLCSLTLLHTEKDM